jgi:hypothetical protein
MDHALWGMANANLLLLLLLMLLLVLLLQIVSRRVSTQD